ncbi:MAG: hypothetical protein JEZ08_15720 [Clostridiales bacterium]|nr:hypothetical protein [Clostridiales bacterium]
MNKNDVLRHLGYDNQKIDQDLDEMIDKSMKSVDRLNGKYVYRIFDFEHGDDINVLDTILKLKGDSIKHMLSQANQLILFAGTLGHEMDQKILKSSYDSSLSMMILDACASVRIEDILDQMEDEIKRTHPGYLTPRFSPGYGDLPLDIQRDLIEVVGAKKIGIHVTDSSMLLPKKSVTGVIGISNNKMTVTYRFCDDCLLRTSCDFKRCKREGQ